MASYSGASNHRSASLMKINKTLTGSVMHSSLKRRDRTRVPADSTRLLCLLFRSTRPTDRDRCEPRGNIRCGFTRFSMRARQSSARDRRSCGLGVPIGLAVRASGATENATLCRQPFKSAVGRGERVGERLRDVRRLLATVQRKVRRPVERYRIGIEQIGHHVWIRLDGRVECRAGIRRAAVDAQPPQQTAVRPQGLRVVLMLGEQSTSLVVQTEFQQRDKQQVSDTLVVAGIQLQQCPIVCQRLVVTPQVSE